MAMRGLLHHPLHARPHSFVVAPRHLLPSRSSFSFEEIRRRLSSSTTTSRRIQCMKMEDEAGAKMEPKKTPEAQLASSEGNTDAIEYVNKAAPGPMVEVDPVTVFRRIIAERRASLAMARAKQQADAAVVQSTAPAPFLLGRKWSGKSMIAIFVALVFLALAAASYILRSKTDREKPTELTSTEGKDNADVSTDNGRRKLVKDTIKAPESVLTAMAIGAASVGRPKGHIGSTHDTLHAGNGTLADTQRPEGGAYAKPIESTAIGDVKTEGPRIPTSGQVPYNLSSIEGFGSFKAQNVGVDVTEGPWFAQAADDGGSSKPEASIQSTSVVEEVVLAQRQELHVSTKTVVQKLVSKLSVNEVQYETPPLNSVVDGEFLGEVVSVSVATEEAVEVSENGARVERFKFEAPEDDVVLADSSAILEKLEQMTGQESTEGKNVVGEIDAPEQNLLVDTPALDLSNDQINVTDMDADISNTGSDSDDGEAHFEVKQSLTPLPAPADEVSLLKSIDSEVKDEGTDSLDAPFEVKQSLTPLPAPADKVVLLKPCESEVKDEGQGTDSLDAPFEVKQSLTPLPAPADKVALLKPVEQSLTPLLAPADKVALLKPIEQSLTPLPAPADPVALLKPCESEVKDEGQVTDSLTAPFDAHFEVKQSLTPLPAPADRVALLKPSDGEVKEEGQGTDSLDAHFEVKQSLTPLPAPADPVALLKPCDSEVKDEGEGADSLDAPSNGHFEVEQSLTPLPAPADTVALLKPIDSEVKNEGQGTNSLDAKEHEDPIKLLSDVDQTLDKIETELDVALENVSLPADNPQTGKVEDALNIGPNHSDGGFASLPADKPQTGKVEAVESIGPNHFDGGLASLPADNPQSGKVEDVVIIGPDHSDGGFVSQTTNEPSTACQEPQTDASVSLNQIVCQDPGAMAYGSTADTALHSLEEDPREDNKKALEAALPALAVGVGTVGTLFGVAGGLQVVGFAALASFLSQDFFWAESREELWQEMKGITDRQKLLEFLARRNIVRKDQ